MYFKRIDMHGFKSFADPVTVEFHNGITCIVGPNGSGKSNISDAIRWVLGEQSPKTLRGGKMEDVIFAGTASRRSRGMAEVTLVIDNSTEILPIDYAEVAITRRMYRSGESEYSINNNHCRLKDIRELIMDTGIGVDGYSLIGQGKIADIVSNKSESRREIFEEAAGIVKYRSRKAESERKLEATRGNLERVNDIVSEIEGRISGLKEDSEKAKEYLVLRDRYKELEINITLKNIETIELKSEYVKDDISELALKIDELKEQKVEFEKELESAREKSDELETLGNEARQKLIAHVEAMNELVNRSKLNEEKLATIHKDELRLNSELSILTTKKEKEQEEETRLLLAKEEIEVKLVALEEALKKKIEGQDVILSNIKGEESEINDRKNSMFALHNFISEKSSEGKGLENLRENLEKRKSQITLEKDDGRKAQTTSALEYKSATDEKQKSEAGLLAVDRESEEIRVSLARNSQEERILAKEQEELRMSFGRLYARKKTIEEMESNYEGYNNAVKFIMRSGLSGIHGVVAELIKVPRGFETAVETALGAALQNIICQEDRDAQGAVSALKANKAGRLTFLPMSSIRSNPYRCDNEMRTTSGFEGVGTDCIEFDEKYKNVMEYLLGRVIIVDSLQNAVKMSKRAGSGLRFVTLEGEVINSGGAITGGAYRNNTANLLERKSEIEKLEETLKELKEKETSSEKRLVDLRKAIESAQDRLKALDLLHRQHSLELNTRENRLEALQKNLTDFDNTQQRYLRELRTIEEEQENSQTMIIKITEDIASARAEIAKLESDAQNRVVAYDEGKLNLSTIGEEITKARVSVGSCQQENENILEMLRRVQGTIVEIESDMRAKNFALENLNTQRNNISSGDDVNAEDVKKGEEEKISMEKYIEEITQAKATLSTKLHENMKKKDRADEEMNLFQTQKYELEIKQAKTETQLEGYKNKLWEEFEVSYLQAIDFKKREFNMNEAVKENREIKSRMKKLGEVNIGAIKEYESVSERYEFLSEQRSDILSAMEALKQIIDDMEKTIKARFKESFDKVVDNFEVVFQSLFGGGSAQLRLEDESKPLDCGIEIIAQPPGKKLQNLNLMSGGEKTMTAIALMFAVLKAKPTPFCILDEVEAALDDANIDRFAHYLKNFGDIQFALVTHQKATMEHADVLYGVTMPEQGISRVISLKLGQEFEALN